MRGIVERQTRTSRNGKREFGKKRGKWWEEEKRREELSRKKSPLESHSSSKSLVVSHPLAEEPVLCRLRQLALLLPAFNSPTPPATSSSLPTPWQPWCFSHQLYSHSVSHSRFVLTSEAANMRNLERQNFPVPISNNNFNFSFSNTTS